MVDGPWFKADELERLDWGVFDGAKHQIMLQASKFGAVGIAWHCIMFHEPMMTMVENTLSIYALSNDKCTFYTKVDYYFTDEEIERLESPHGLDLGPTNVLNWVITALMDPDTNKQFKHPITIEGPKVRIEIG